VTPRGPRAKVLLRGLLKLLAIVVVAGGVGFALGTGLSALSEDKTPTAPDAETATAEPPATGSTATAAELPVATPTTTTPAAPTTTTPDASASPLAEVSVSVLDARLFTDGTPSGRRDQRARLTVRLRAENAGGRRAILPPPILRVGSVRIPADAPAGTETPDEPLPAGTQRTMTLRFSLSGEATPKLVRDRRARLLIAGQSVAMRVKVRSS